MKILYTIKNDEIKYYDYSLEKAQELKSLDITYGTRLVTNEFYKTLKIER